jgi:toxin ParE1/3/4
MARVELAVEVLAHFDRFIDHPLQVGATDVPQRMQDLFDAIQVLTHSPGMGRPIREGKRELVVGKGVRRSVVLYRYVAEIDAVFVLAARAQRESGFKH